MVSSTSSLEPFITTRITPPPALAWTRICCISRCRSSCIFCACFIISSKSNPPGIFILSLLPSAYTFKSPPTLKLRPCIGGQRRPPLRPWLRDVDYLALKFLNKSAHRGVVFRLLRVILQTSVLQTFGYRARPSQRIIGPV